MPPLASMIMDDLVLPPDRRVFRSGFNLRDMMYGIHCFEVTEVKDLVEHYLEGEPDFATWVRKHLTYMFLPAPKTWIEFAGQGHSRCGYVLEQFSDGHIAVVMFRHSRAFLLGFADLKNNIVMPDTTVTKHLPEWQSLLLYPFAFLPMINTPKIIGRRQVMPNWALEKRLTRSFGAGSFPLKAWTEIKLSVSKPTEIDDGEPHEAHLTGKRALHFVRSHLRLWQGQLIYISSHWRGDAAIGIKRSRYKVAR